MAENSDPRVFFAAERTLLAWLRTGIAVIGMGFVVARFGLFLRLMAISQTDLQPPMGSAALGIGLAILGTMIVAGSAWQHARFCRTLSAAERPNNYWSGFALMVSGGVVILGSLLSLHLAWGVVTQ